MDQAGIVNKIYYGYSQAAKRLGAEMTIYRSSSAINPISPDNIPSHSTILATFPPTMDYLKYQNYGNAIYFGIFDARVTYTADYLYDPVLDTTYFIGSQDALVPILCVQCNASISIVRPHSSTAKGYIGYSGRTSTTDIPLYQAAPASVLLKTTKGVNNSVRLPTDTRQPLYTCLVPMLGDVEVKTGDIAEVTWALGETAVNMVVWQVELTKLGYRLQLEELGA